MVLLYRAYSIARRVHRTLIFPQNQFLGEVEESSSSDHRQKMACLQVHLQRSMCLTGVFIQKRISLGAFETKNRSCRGNSSLHTHTYICMYICLSLRAPALSIPGASYPFRLSSFLHDNSLTTLPAGVFEDLGSGTVLRSL